MRSVEDAVEHIEQVSQDDWVKWALGRGNWPLRIPLGAPRGAQFDQNITAAQLWAASWDAARAKGIPGTIDTEPRRARGLGTHELPTSWTLNDPLEALKLSPEIAQQFATACERFGAAVDMPEVVWNSVESIPLTSAKTIAKLSDGDWLNATATVVHIADGPGDALILRQLAVPGVHTKWIEDNAALLGAMLGAAGPGDPQTRLETHIGLLAEQAPIHVYLPCPQLRAAAAGMDRFAASVATLNASSLVPESILIIENRKLGNTLEFHAADLAVLYGLGYGATALVDLRWTATAKTIIYWGDIDRAGLAILASVRRAGMNVQAILMDEQTWDRYPDHQHDSVRDQGLSDADVPEGLREAERKLYERLNEERRGGGKDRQLEQEHIPLVEVFAALRARIGAAVTQGNA
jgi:hypothetical protein